MSDSDFERRLREAQEQGKLAGFEARAREIGERAAAAAAEQSQRRAEMRDKQRRIELETAFRSQVLGRVGVAGLLEQLGKHIPVRGYKVRRFVGEGPAQQQESAWSGSDNEGNSTSQPYEYTLDGYGLVKDEMNQGTRGYKGFFVGFAGDTYGGDDVYGIQAMSWWTPSTGSPMHAGRWGHKGPSIDIPTRELYGWTEAERIARTEEFVGKARALTEASLLSIVGGLARGQS
jgi:hypothetical protein